MRQFLIENAISKGQASLRIRTVSLEPLLFAQSAHRSRVMPEYRPLSSMHLKHMQWASHELAFDMNHYATSKCYKQWHGQSDKSTILMSMSVNSISQCVRVRPL